MVTESLPKQKPSLPLFQLADTVENKTADDAPIIQYLNQIIWDAIQIKASDIHFEPFQNTLRIRYRHDGILSEIPSPAFHLTSRLLTRLKIMAKLDISERRMPQDGRFKINLIESNTSNNLKESMTHNKTIDFRVSTCPTLFGEKVVLRILDPRQTQLNVDELGLEPEQKSLFLKAIEAPQGLILVTGPTGSGKTVTLYTALNQLNTPEKNISTCEDPVEFNLPGITQVPVNVKIGLTFETVLRSFLRQDPDIIMVGEIRDFETANIALKAAETGHLVFSSLHTTSAESTLIRLLNMGIPHYHLAASISLIIAQRLVRVLCPFCKILEPPSLSESSDFSGFSGFYGPNKKGCPKCHQGYKGRTGVFEVLPITPAISNIILSKGHAQDIEKQARRENVLSLKSGALNKLQQGITSIEEVINNI